MKSLKILFLFLVAFALTGCVESDGPPVAGITEVSEEQIKEFMENYEFDLNYPYPIDFLIKQQLGEIEEYDSYQFRMVEDYKLIVGENNVEIEVIHPDGKKEVYSFVLTVVDAQIDYKLDDFVFNKETQTIELYKGNDMEVVIPPMIDGVSVLKLGESSFKDKLMTTIYIPDSITEIEEMAFYNCFELSNIRMGLNITKVGEFAYAKTGLEKVKLNDEIATSYGNFAYHLAPIKEVVFDDQVDMDLILKNWNRLSISVEAIPNIQSEKGVYYLESNKTIYGIRNDYDGLRIGMITNELGLERINDYLFYGDSRNDNRRMGDYYFGESIKIIGSYAFYNSEISGLQLPEGLETIEANAFENSSIQDLELPNSLVTIEDHAFLGSSIFRIHLDENETRFNSRWEVIGFDENLKPREREIEEAELIIQGEDDDFLMHSIRVGDIVYAIGYTWSKELAFENDSEAAILPFLFKYDFSTKSHQLNLLHYEEEASFESLMKLDDDTFLAIGYKAMDQVVFPYYIKFDQNLNVISDGIINDSNMRIVTFSTMNDKKEIGVVSENKTSKGYDFIIFDENFSELYRYTMPSAYNSWYAQGIKSQGDDFLVYGTMNQVGKRVAFIVRANTKGVVFEYIYDGGMYATINSLEILEDRYFVNIYIEDEEMIHYFAYLSHAGEVIGEVISLDDFDYHQVNQMFVYGDRIYVLARDDYKFYDTTIYYYDLNMNYLGEKFFTNYSYSSLKFYEYEGEMYLFFSSNDQYFHNGQNKNRLNILVMTFDFS